MTPSAALTSFFSLVSLVGSALVGVKLFYLHLNRKYPVFSAYCFFRAAYLAYFLTFSDFRSAAYLKFWVATEPIIWVFYVLLVMELYSLVLENHKGLYTLGRWAMYVSLAVSLTVSGLTMMAGWTAANVKRSLLLAYFFAIERGIVFSLLLFLLIALFFLSRYPVPLSRNVVLHSLAYSALFLSNTLGLFVRSVLGVTVSRAVSLSLMAVSSVCILVWLVFFDAEGERSPMKLPRLDPMEEERVLSQLATLNSTVLKISHK